MLTGSWFVRYCLWLWNENRTKQENNTVCISVFVPLCARVCVYFLAGSPLGQMERVFCLPSLSQCLFLSCSFSFLSNHSFPLAVNRQVGKSICTHTHIAGHCCWLHAAFFNLPRSYNVKAKHGHTENAYTRRVGSSYAWPFTHPRSEQDTHSHRLKPHREYREEPITHSFLFLLSTKLKLHTYT